MDVKPDNQNENGRQGLTEAMQKLKALNFASFFTEGALIDANDNNGSWRVARISQIKGDTATLTFDGWSSKWDEHHKLGSNKLAPFRKNTPPYTGPLKNTNRNIDLKDFLGSISKNMQLMDQISNQGFLIDPYQITQTVRGEIFIIIDAILHFSFNDAKEHLKTFIDFLDRFIRFFVEYLTILPNLLKDYIEGKAMNLQLYLVHEKIAAASCFPEFFSSIAKIFGAESRCIRFFQENEFFMNTFTKAFVTKPKDRHSSSHTQIVNFVNLFGNLGGFDRLLDLMKWEHVPEPKKQNEPVDSESVYKFPFLMIKQILVVIDPIINMMSSSFKDVFLNEFKRLFFLRIDNISIREIKDIDPTVAFSLLGCIQTILDEICVKETFQLTEEAELNLSLKLLKSPFLQKKIRGITHFKECIERTDSSSSDFRNSEPKRKMKYFTTETLRRFFSNNCLLDIILGENFHVEVFKRSQPILKFFATSGGFTSDQLSALWKAVETKHEGYTTAIYELFIELLKSLSLESLEILFSKIITTPQEKCDDAIINLMQEFSIIAMGNLNSQTGGNQYSAFLSGSKTKKTLKDSKNEFFALRFLWDLAQDQSKLDVKYIDQCLTSLNQLLKSSYFKSEKEKYLNLCFENVKQGVSVPQSLHIALHIFSTYNTYAMFSRESLEDVLNKYNKEYNLNELVISDCEEYLKQVGRILDSNRAKGVKIDNIGQNIFLGKYNHHDQIEGRLSFLQTIDPHVDKKYSISLDQIKRLWVIMIKRAVSPVEQGIFLAWLTKPKDSSSKRSFCFSDSMLKSIFLSVISDKVLMEDYVNISPEVYGCVQTLFEIVNMNEDLLENTGKNMKKVLKYDGLFGMEHFWNILIRCQNEAVQRLCRNFLINIHLKFGSNVSTEQRLKIWQNFINKCLDFLNNNVAIPLIISLVKGFFENIQGTKFLPSKDPVVSSITFPVQIRSTSEEPLQKRNLTLPSNATFLSLRLQIIEEFNLKNVDFEFVVYANNMIRLSPENEEEVPVSVMENQTLKDKTVYAQLTKGLTRESFLTKDKFKQQMANNPKFTDTLFELLSNNNDTLVKEVWEILTGLPLNKNLKGQIEKFASVDGSEENWNKLLDYSCYRKFMYCLEIIDDILDSDNSEEWSLKFCKKKGFTHLLRIFDQITEEKTHNIFNLKCFGLLAKIITIFLTKNYSLLSQILGEMGKVISNIVSKAISQIFDALCFVVSCSSKAENADEEENQMPEEFMSSYLRLILTIFNRNRSVISILYKFKDLSQLFRLALLECNDPKIRTVFQNGILAFLEEPRKWGDNQAEVISPPQIFFLNRLLTDYKENTNFLAYRSKCNNYFDLTSILLHKIPKDEIKDALKTLRLPELLDFLIIELFNLPTFEKLQTDNDYYLQGILKLFESLIFLNGEFRAQLVNNPDFIPFIYDTCLFEKPHGLEPSNSILPPKCKSPESRKAAFALLSVLLISEENASPKIIEIIEKMKGLLGCAYWRSNAIADWNISSMYMEKSIAGYVGLKNLGCTCYMNSLLQQFFMIPEFRETILAVPSKNGDNIEDSENLLYQFQLIMAALKNSHKQYHDPRGFCHANKDYEGKPVNVLEQMDVDEFFNNFLDKLEGQIKHSRNPDIIKKIFGGTLSNELLCKGCPHHSEREEMFLALSLQVKNKKSIAESLDGFIQGEMLEGENAYFCDKCDKKVQTLKRTCIKKLPNMLILVLKRFEFDYDKMIKIKLNDLCEFPQKINMMQYTQSFIKRREKDKNTEDLENDDSNAITTIEDELPPEYYDYTLKGVVIHLGTADSGHYYSLISESQDKWLEFNDIHVRKFDINDLASEAFGGDEKNIANSMMNTLSKSMKERSKNAYLLFYQRGKNFDENGSEISQLAMPEETGETPRFFNEIKEDNVKYYIIKNCFDNEYSSFVLRLLTRNVESKINEAISLNVYKLGFLYFFAVIVRFKDRERLIPSLVKILKKALNGSVELANWFLMNASSEEIVRETLIECPIKDIKYIISGLYIEAIKRLGDERRDSMVRMLDICLYLLAECKERKIMDVFYRIFIAFSRCSRVYKLLMFERKFIGIFYYYITEQALTDLALQRPLPLENNELAGLAKQKSSVNIRSIEELVEKKKEKALLENVAVSYSNLIIAYSNLVCSISFAEGAKMKSPTLLEQMVDYKPDNDERKMIFLNSLWRRILIESQAKSSWKPVARMFAHLSMNNKQVTLEVLKVSFEDFSGSDENLKVYLKVFEGMMSIDDDMRSSRINFIAEKLVIIFKENLKFYRFSTVLLEYFFKMCGRSSTVLRAFSVLFSDKQNLKPAEEWVKSLRELSYHLNSGNYSIYRKKKAVMNTQILLLHNQKFIKKLQEKLMKLNKICKEEKEALQLDYDSDEDYLDPPPKINDKIDIMLENGSIISGTVVDTFEEMFCVKNGAFSRWLPYDYEKAGPYGKMRDYYEEIVEFYK